MRSKGMRHREDGSSGVVRVASDFVNRTAPAGAESGCSTGGTGLGRRRDLDALRAVAMLLGIAYHAALSFCLGGGWMVRDVNQSKALYVFQAFVHGFRMQLFMLLSGYFTAMVWRGRGLGFLIRQRFMRVFFPCCAGLVTVVPAVKWAGNFASKLRGEGGRFEGAGMAEAAVGGPPNPLDFGVETEAGGGGPDFIVVWFLWFLVWLLPFFLAYACEAERYGWRMRPWRFVVSQRSLLWLVPLTMVPAAFMGHGRGEFGPDTSMGILPLPHVFGYYGLFFGFGVLYFECGDAEGRLGSCWRWTMPAVVLVVFPLALESADGPFGLRERLFPKGRRVATVFFQVLYAWMMVFAWMGMFRSLVRRGSREGRAGGLIRYLSEASYWCYLAHLPVVVVLQAVVAEWLLPAWVKFLGVCVTVCVVVLVSYHTLVRDSFIGVFLNGRTVRPGWLRRSARAGGAGIR